MPSAENYTKSSSVTILQNPSLYVFYIFNSRELIANDNIEDVNCLQSAGVPLPKHLIRHLFFTTHWDNSADDKCMLFFIFSQTIGFDISRNCLRDNFCVKCQILFSKEDKKEKKKNSKCRLLKFLPRMLSGKISLITATATYWNGLKIGS